MKVISTVVSHRHGTDLWVRPLTDDASNDLYEYVCEWWDEITKWDGPPATPPADKQQAIDIYFEYQDNEWYLEQINELPPSGDELEQARSDAESVRAILRTDYQPGEDVDMDATFTECAEALARFTIKQWGEL